jgi:hypothetical protein
MQMLTRAGLIVSSAVIVTVGSSSAASRRSAPAIPRVAVLAFDLENLTPVGATAAELAATAAAGPALRRSLAADCGYVVVLVDSASQAQANAGVGYLFDHPAESARLASAVGADWVVVGRLAVASPIVSEFDVELVRVSTGALVQATTIELKGDPGDTTIFMKGLAHVGRQLDRALEAATPVVSTSASCPSHA